MTALTSYPVWDRTTRWFHWINVLCILALTALGLVLMNDDALEIGLAGKIILKQLHVSIGYLFVLNLLWRLVWAFMGNRYARWGAVLPFGAGYMQRLRAFLDSLRAGSPQPYAGHNPVAQLVILAMLLAMLAQATTGLVLAGTDLFWLPLGGWFASWVAAPGVDPATLVASSRDGMDQAAWTAMRAFRSNFRELHEISFYTLIVLIGVHLVGVVVGELREGSALVSAMFTGRKVHDRPPVDLAEDRDAD